MTRAEGVVNAFLALEKARQAAVLLQRMKILVAAGYQLVRISLMPRVPHDFIARRIVHLVQSDSQIHRAQIAGQMPALFGHLLDHGFAHLLCELLEFIRAQFFEVGGGIDFLQHVLRFQRVLQ